MPRDWTHSTIGERLDFLRSVTGLSQNKFGEKIGLNSGEISRLRKAKNPSAKQLKSIADALDESLEWIASGCGSPRCGERAKDPVEARPLVLAMAREIVRDEEPEVFDAAEAVFLMREFPVGISPEDLQLAFLDELTRARAFRDLLQKRPPPKR